jgi:hypothetical protein
MMERSAILAFECQAEPLRQISPMKSFIPSTASVAATMNGHYPRSTMSLDFSRGLITRSAYGEKIGIELHQGSPLRRTWHGSGKPNSLPT